MATHAFHHAVVAGGSMAGLLATRVLADHFERVTLIERDVLPSNSEPRKGVPQGRHAHVLLVRGQGIMESFFPGLTEELCAAGAVRVGVPELAWLHAGHWRVRYHSELSFLAMSRPLLEIKSRSACVLCRMSPSRMAHGWRGFGMIRSGGSQVYTRAP